MQDTESELMYFIIKGECAISIKNENRQSIISSKLLVEGNHFGEIGLIYDCPRTATVLSRNYSLLGTIDQKNLTDVLAEHPVWDQYLKKQIYSYDDSRKKFLWKSMRQIDFLRQMTIAQFHDVMYEMRLVLVDNEEYLLKEDDETDTLFIVESGVLEVYLD